MRTFSGADELVTARGETLGTRDWVAVGQERIDAFADATGGRQWIRYGGMVAHGYPTLSLLPVLFQQAYTVDGVRMAINCGLNKVRFPAFVPAGSKVRATVVWKEAVPLDGAVQVTMSSAGEAEGGGKPVCVAESIARYIR